ncbi:hypothetical protein Tco_1154294 [Tanacetum coccineum]
MMVQAQQEQVEEAINKENVPTHSNDPLLNGEDRLKLEELMALCTNLQNKVLNLEHTKTTQALEIDSLKRRVKKLENKQRTRKEVSTADLVTTAGEVVTTAGEVVTTANVEVSTVSPTAATITTVELTLAQTLAELKSARPKIKGVVMQEPSETTTTIPSKDKGKGIMVEEPLKMKKKDQVLFDEQTEIHINLSISIGDFRFVGVNLTTFDVQPSPWRKSRNPPNNDNHIRLSKYRIPSEQILNIGLINLPKFSAFTLSSFIASV